MRKLPNIHPGEILLKEFLNPLHISQNKIAKDIGLQPRKINEICLYKRAITADIAIRLGKYFSIEPEFWLNLQNMYEMEEAKKEKIDIYCNIKSLKSA